MKTSEQQIHDFGMYVGQVAGDVNTVQRYLGAEATNQEGFTGLLSPLQAAMDQLRQLCADVNQQIEGKLTSVSIGIQDTGTSYGDTERANAGMFPHPSER